jgi:hypothetical protein
MDLNYAQNVTPELPTVSQSDHAAFNLFSVTIAAPAPFSEKHPAKFEVPRNEFEDWKKKEEARTHCKFYETTNSITRKKNVANLEEEKRSNGVIIVQSRPAGAEGGSVMKNLFSQVRFIHITSNISYYSIFCHNLC